MAPTGATGYYVLGANGAIFNYGNAPYKGSVPDHGLHISAVLMTLTPRYEGYWIAGSDGGIFSFGDAGYFGSVPGLGLCESLNGVQLSTSVGGNGYYIVSDRGRVFAFGAAPFLGEPAATGAVTRDIAAVRR